MKNHNNFYLYCLVIFKSICHSHAVTFYEHSDFKGHGFKVKLHSGHYYVIPPEWNDRISSINTENQCIVIYEHSDCQGKSSRVAPDTPSHHSLGDFGFNDVISSVKTCSRDTESGGAGGQGNSDGIQNAGVNEHNKYRRRHGSPDLTGDQSLHNIAQKYAEHLAANDLFKHSGKSGVGENLAANQVEDKVGAVRFAVKQWYDEVGKYNYDKPGFSLDTGHFTAVVWRSTKHLGIGIAWNPKKRWWVVVANYSPPGNFGGQYEENVKRPL